MRKNVNSEVTMNAPIQDYAYPDDLAPAAAYDRILQFLSLQRRKLEQCLCKVMSPMGRKSKQL